MRRRTALSLVFTLPYVSRVWAQADPLAAVLARAAGLAPLKAVLVARNGETVASRGYHGHAVTAPTNIKSASKSVVSALAGIAIETGVFPGVDQTIAPLFKDDLPPKPDPRLAQITIGHLLSMQAGLARTSGVNYGRWVASPNWVRAALAQPFEEEPGGFMQYSTGSTHLLSALLTRLSGRSTLALAREWLGPVDGFAIVSWDKDPQGIYFGGNQMAMSAVSLLAFGELYRNAGRTRAGKQIVSPAWIAASWQPRTNSKFTGDAYGYGWFLRDMGGHEVRYGWGFGGQMLYIVPSLGLTVAMTSDDRAQTGQTQGRHRDDLHQLMTEIIEIESARRT